MSVLSSLQERSGNLCELCTSSGSLEIYLVPPAKEGDLDKSIYACAVCTGQLQHPETLDPNHWRCLNESMWSQVPSVQVVAYRTLQLLEAQPWAQDLLSQIYLDEDTLAFAEALNDQDGPTIHKDCNGNILENGDTVTLIQDLNVKGANFVAKRGTAVRRIMLVEDNAAQIEGKVNDQHIVILTKFVKKSS
jgi:protein PhnA